MHTAAIVFAVLTVISFLSFLVDIGDSLKLGISQTMGGLMVPLMLAIASAWCFGRAKQASGSDADNVQNDDAATLDEDEASG